MSTDANRLMQHTYTAVEKLILIDFTNDHLPTYYNKKIPAFIFFVVVFPVYFLPS